MKVNYVGTDVLICNLFNEEGNECTAVIACNDESENSLYSWCVRLLNQTGIEIGTLRTVFGLTFYAGDERTKNALQEFIKASNFKTYHGHL